MVVMALVYGSTSHSHSSMEGMLFDGQFDAPAVIATGNGLAKAGGGGGGDNYLDHDENMKARFQSWWEETSQQHTEKHQDNLRSLKESKETILQEIEQARRKALDDIEGASKRSNNAVTNSDLDSNGYSAIASGNAATNVNANTENSAPLGILEADSPIKDFERLDRVVIASKIHGHFHWGILEQALCLFQHAYNDRMNYDIVVFSTIPMDGKEDDMERVRKMVAPATFTVVVDNPGLHEQVRSLSLSEQADVLKRCNTSTVEELIWDVKCQDKGAPFPVKMSYTWQAEFRSLYLWTRPELEKYKWMMWIDSDTFSIHKWKHDPIAVAVRNEMVLFFANWPKGRSMGKDFADKFRTAFDGTGIFKDGETLCDLYLENGHLVPVADKCDGGVRIRQVHGFFHISDLDFMRSSPAQKFFKAYIGETHFSRKFDDQLAVTAVSGVLAPERACDMESYGVDLGIWHNGDVMGKESRRTAVWKFTKWWKANATEHFPEALNCKVIHNG